MVFNAVLRLFGAWYRQSLRRRLGEYGLKYEDLFVETADVKKALTRIDPETLRARELRIKRAFDLSVKKKFMPKELQKGDPLERYLEKEIEAAKLEREERSILNGY